MTLPVLYDAGVLIAAERNTRFVWGIQAKSVRARLRPIVPAPVLAQVWRGGPRQARLAKFVASCDVLALDEPLARAAGELMDRADRHDVVDAVVAVLAVGLRAIVVTSDPDDITHLCRASGLRVPEMVTV